MPEDIIVSAQNVTKQYRDVTAVNDLTLTVRRGAIFAFLGANGAGKSTTINMLTTSLQPTSGIVSVAGYELGKQDGQIRRAIGVVFQQSLLDPLLTVRENLVVRAQFYELQNINERIAELAGLIGLEDFIDRRYGRLSGGQRRRADIARALIHTPKLLFLDEPTTGLDPKSREDVWRTIADLQSKTGLTVFLTTHYMEEAERADEVCVIRSGRIVAHDTPQALRATYTTDTLTLVATDQEVLLGELLARNVNAVSIKGKLSVRVDSAQEALGLLKRYEKEIVDFEFRHGNMDDVFLALAEGIEAR